MKGKIRIRKAEDAGVYAVKTMKFITEEQAAEIFAKKERAAWQKRQKRKKEAQS